MTCPEDVDKGQHHTDFSRPRKPHLLSLLKTGHSLILSHSCLSFPCLFGNVDHRAILWWAGDLPRVFISLSPNDCLLCCCNNADVPPVWLTTGYFISSYLITMDTLLVLQQISGGCSNPVFFNSILSVHEKSLKANFLCDHGVAIDIFSVFCHVTIWIGSSSPSNPG